MNNSDEKRKQFLPEEIAAREEHMAPGQWWTCASKGLDGLMRTTIKQIADIVREPPAGVAATKWNVEPRVHWVGGGKRPAVSSVLTARKYQPAAPPPVAVEEPEDLLETLQKRVNYLERQIAAFEQRIVEPEVLLAPANVRIGALEERVEAVEGELAPFRAG